MTPHKALGTELGGTNLGAHMSELYKFGVMVRPDSRLTAVVPRRQQAGGDGRQYL